MIIQQFESSALFTTRSRLTSFIIIYFLMVLKIENVAEFFTLSDGV